jgi:hypothetical protein
MYVCQPRILVSPAAQAPSCQPRILVSPAAQAPSQGWSPYRPLGLASYGKRAPVCWLGELHALVAAGFPVIVLQHYSIPVQPGDGHFRYEGSSLRRVAACVFCACTASVSGSNLNLNGL